MKTKKHNLKLVKSSLIELNNTELKNINGGGDTIDLISLIIRNWTRPIL